MADVFISHHTASGGEVAEKLCAALEKEGVSCWFAERDVKKSAYAGDITKAIDQCKVFVLLLNEGANRSTDVADEVGLARARMKKGETIELLPFRLDDTDVDKLNDDLRYFLNRINIMDGGTPDAPRLPEMIERVKKCPGIQTDAVKERSDAPKIRKDWDKNDAAEIIDKDAVERAKADCSEADIQAYFSVSADFGVTLRTLSADRDIPRKDADETIASLLDGAPAIIGGNGGMGKSSLMMRQAIRWARDGGIAVWLCLNAAPNRAALDAAQSEELMTELTREAENGEKILLCLENPDEGRQALRNLRKAWLKSGVPTGREAAKRGGYVQLLMAERSNRLEKLTARNDDCLLDWFDGAKVAELRPAGETRNPRKLKDYAVTLVAESMDFRAKVLVSAMERYKKDVGQKQWSLILQDVKSRYNQPDVSLVELVYRTLFRLKQVARKTSAIVMDWDEWSRIFEPMPNASSYTPFQLYGGIAALRLFDMPMTLNLFCRPFQMRTYDLTGQLRDWRAKRNVEPVIYRPGPAYDPGAGTLAPKHDVIAELFFLFYPDDSPIDEALCDYLNVMNEPEIEAFLKKVTDRNTMRDMDKQWRKRELGRPNFRDYFKCIFMRTQNSAQKNGLRLSEEGMTQLCLGILWSNGGKRIAWNQEIQDILEAAAPELDKTRLKRILYTEWGICLNKAERTMEAEEKFRAVMDVDSYDLQSRTELGRLLVNKRSRNQQDEMRFRQEAEELFREVILLNPDDIKARTELGRLLSCKRGQSRQEEQRFRDEAEKLFRMAMSISPLDIQSRTELGRLLSRKRGQSRQEEQRFRDEAEKLFRKAMSIDRKHIQSRTELGILLANQPGREKDAEEYFRAAIDLDPKNIAPHTEYGILLSHQPGREKDAERLFRKVMALDKNHCYSRSKLAELYINQGRLREAKELYQEILRINPTDRYGLAGLKRVEELEKR